MEYQNKLSKLRHLALKIQGQDLKQVLLRSAGLAAECIADNVHTTEEIFHALSEKIYERVNEMSWDECFTVASDADKLAELKDELFNKLIGDFEWDETKFVLVEGLEGSELATIGALLENQRNYMASDVAAGNKPLVAQKILIPMVRRIYENLSVADLVGFQAMQGPVGLSYFLRFREQEPLVEDTISPDEVASSSFGGATIGRKLTLDVVTHAVEAQSRKLQAAWTIEAMQDINTMHGLNIEAVLISALADEIRIELTAEILSDLRNLAGEAAEYKLTGNLESQIMRLAINVNLAANEIARKTRRGAGNFVVVDTSIAKALEDFYEQVPSNSVYVPNGAAVNDLGHIGTLNGGIRVYASTSAIQGEILVGYKGGNGEIDTGYVHTPYIPVMSAGVVVNSISFQPVMALMTRYGKALNETFKYDEEGNRIDEAENFSHAGDYYENIKIESDLFTVKDDKR